MQVGILSHKPFPLPKWRALFYPFRLGVWLGLAAALAGFAAAYLAITGLTEPELRLGPAEALLLTVKSLLRQRELK